MQISHEVKLCRLRNFFEIYLDRARDLAKAGRKDDARDWLRFFSNAGLFDLLSDPQHGVLTDEEKSWLRSELLLLESECHPLDVPDHLTDLQAIRSHLELITVHLGIQQFVSESSKFFESVSGPSDVSSNSPGVAAGHEISVRGSRLKRQG